MAKAAGADEEFRDRARAKDISFGNRETVEGDDEGCCVVVEFFNEHTSLVVLLLLGRCGRMLSCKLATKLMFVWLLLSAAPNSIIFQFADCIYFNFCYFLLYPHHPSGLQLSSNYYGILS